MTIWRPKPIRLRRVNSGGGAGSGPRRIARSGDDFLHESVRLPPRLINFFWGIGPYVTTNGFEG
jgi:hypothetical protein